jgi:hypothetical protein
MNFEQNKSAERLGGKAGFLFSYLLFTTVMFLVLQKLKKLPLGWSYGHVILLTGGITLTGLAVGRLLK